MWNMREIGFVYLPRPTCGLALEMSDNVNTCAKMTNGSISWWLAFNLLQPVILRTKHGKNLLKNVLLFLDWRSKTQATEAQVLRRHFQLLSKTFNSSTHSERGGMDALLIRDPIPNEIFPPRVILCVLSTFRILEWTWTTTLLLLWQHPC